MRYLQTLKVPSETAHELERICKEPDSGVKGDGVEFDQEVVFENGMRMAIQVCASGNPTEESCWTQGVLFDQHGNERGCTDVGESFLGEYCVPDGDDEYVTEVCAAAPEVSAAEEEFDFTQAAEIVAEAAAYLTEERVLPCDESLAVAESLQVLSRRLLAWSDRERVLQVLEIALSEVFDTADGVHNGAAVVYERLFAAPADDGA